MHCSICSISLVTIIGTSSYKNKLILIDSQLVKTNGATFIFIEKSGNKFLAGQFWRSQICSANLQVEM